MMIFYTKSIFNGAGLFIHRKSLTRQNSMQSVRNIVMFPPSRLLRPPENDRKPQIWPVSVSQSAIKSRKINRLWPKSNQFWRWSGYNSTPNFRSFLPCILKKMSGNLWWTDGWKVNWLVRRPGNESGGQFDRRMKGQMDGWTTWKHNANGA